MKWHEMEVAIVFSYLFRKLNKKKKGVWLDFFCGELIGWLCMQEGGEVLLIKNYKGIWIWKKRLMCTQGQKFDFDIGGELKAIRRIKNAPSLGDSFKCFWLATAFMCSTDTSVFGFKKERKKRRKRKSLMLPEQI